MEMKYDGWTGIFLSTGITERVLREEANWRGEPRAIEIQNTSDSTRIYKAI